MKWPKKSPNGKRWWKAQQPRYFDRKAGWAVDERSAMFRPLTDWEFLAKHGSRIPAWARPDYRPLKKAA